MLVDLFLVLVGLIFLFVGGEGLVSGSVAIAEKLNVSKLITGIVIVGAGTSMPELFVSVQAAKEGSPDIALGNVIGSNTSNLLLILGVTVLIMPITSWSRSALAGASVAALAAVALYALVHTNTITQTHGLALIAGVVAYFGISIWREYHGSASVAPTMEAEIGPDGDHLSAGKAVVYVLGGMALLLFGADFLVEGSVSIARTFLVPEAVIGLSLVALGTSLPELAAAIVASVKKHSDVVVGNVIGSNILNILAIIGTTAVIHPIAVNPQFRIVDVPIMLAASLILVALLAFAKKISRGWGIAMLLAYVSYIVYLYHVGLAI